MSAVQMTDVQFKELLQTIRALGPDTKKLEQEAAAKRSKASFSKCNAKFNGQFDNYAVDNFITAVDMYKKTEDISDKDALKGISLLFNGLAATWWKGVRRNINTWDELLNAMREHFIPAKPVYEIYEDLFQRKQDSYTHIDTFVLEKRAILSRLPDGLHDEETQINFIYAMLNEKYRKEIPRHKIQTFQQLLEKGRDVQRSR